MAKPGLYSDDAGLKRSSQEVLSKALVAVLRLIHPFMPFITEELWQRMPHEGKSVMRAPYPEPEEFPYDTGSLEEMELVSGAIAAIRNIRGEMNIPPGKRVNVVIEAPVAGEAAVLEENLVHIKNLASVEQAEILAETEKPEASASGVFGGNQVHVLLKGLLDFEEEKKRLRKAIQKMEKEMTSSNKKLANPSFLEKAPSEVVQEVREKVRDMELRLKRLNDNLQFFEAI
jgi:valyl-tRNA synthetase